MRMALGVAANDSRTISTTINIASMADSQFSKQQESSDIFVARSYPSHRGSTITGTPIRHGLKSIQTLTDGGMGVYPMVNCI